jgi:hypothetical protein
MTRIASLLTLLVTVLVCLLPAAPALAQRDRVFVASYGSDSNPCTFGSPCKTFQQAVNSVAFGGEVTAIDSAGFGTIIISQAVTITSPNGVEAGIAAPAGGNAAITVNAQSGDIISLNGLTLDGDSVSNTTGIQFNAGGSLEVQNCAIRNFGLYGINFLPSTSSQFAILNTLLSDNSNGINMQMPLGGSGAVNGVFDHLTIQNSEGAALYINSATQTLNITVSNSVIANNQSTGIESFSQSSSGPVGLMVQDSTITNNGGYALLANGSANSMWVTRSVITGNGGGVDPESSAKLLSFGDNNIIGNTLGTAPTKTAEE